MPILFNNENTIEIITFGHKRVVKNPKPPLSRFAAWLGKLIGAA